MKEANLRKWHRTGGILFAFFIVVQALTGLILTLEDILGTGWGDVFQTIHTHIEGAGEVNRVLAGFGMLFMACTGVWIWFMIRRRTHASARAHKEHKGLDSAGQS